MYTQCPHCGTVFTISAAQLAVCHGQVRCGSCAGVFSALEALCETLDPSGGIPTCFHSERPPTLPNPADAYPMMGDLFSRLETPDFILRQEQESAETPGEEDFDPEIPETAPPHGLTPETRDRLWSSATVFLTAFLIAQLGWSQRDRLVQSEAWRPWLQRICIVAGCEIPLRQDIESIRLVNRSIRPHPSVTSALMISATMQNQAPFIQPYPTIEIVLSDLAGRRVAMRRFAPDEYMESQGRSAQGMPTGTLLPLVFEVVDPGQDAVAFEFAFR